MKLSEIYRTKIFILLCLLLVLIDFMYPVTFTFDSGHYFSYVSIINNKRPMSEWDPVRGVVFPGLLKISIDIMGQNENAFLIPMIIFHLLLFLLSVYFIFSEVQFQNNRLRNFMTVVIFIWIALDPIIFGYFHTLLTEYFASTLAIISCLIAYHLYKSFSSPARQSRNVILSVVFFVISAPLGWHLKQPYVGTVLFPLMLISVLIIFKYFNWRTFFIMFSVNGLVLLSLIISIIFWNGFLPNTKEAENRKSEKFVSGIMQANATLFWQSPGTFFRYMAKNYLALSNIYLYNTLTKKMNTEFSLFNADENEVIAYRMYKMNGMENTFPMTSNLREGIDPFVTDYNPPSYFNEFQIFFIPKSNIMFSLLYLVLPLAFPITLFIKAKKYRKSNQLVIACLLSGSALMNIVLHSFLTIQPQFLNLPIDRYAFWGYPLNLMYAILMLSLLIQFFSRQLRRLPLWKRIFLAT